MGGIHIIPNACCSEARSTAWHASSTAWSRRAPPPPPPPPRVLPRAPPRSRARGRGSLVGVVGACHAARRSGELPSGQ